MPSTKNIRMLLSASRMPATLCAGKVSGQAGGHSSSASVLAPELGIWSLPRPSAELAPPSRTGLLLNHGYGVAGSTAGQAPKPLVDAPTPYLHLAPTPAISLLRKALFVYIR